jgi:hypothetical protein
MHAYPPATGGPRGSGQEECALIWTAHAPWKGTNMANTSWLLANVDTAGEVIFAAAITLTHPVFTGLPNMNRTYF